MKEIEFKVGDKVFCHAFGFGTVGMKSDLDLLKIVFDSPEDKGPLTVNKNGRLSPDAKYRVILTLEEAALLGVFPEKKKKKVKLYQVLAVENYVFRISNTLFEDELDAIAHYGEEFVRLLTDNPIEVEVDEE